MTPRKRGMLGTFLGLGIVIGGVTLINQIRYNMGGEISLYRSSSNLFSLFSTGSYFSRSMILYLNCLAQSINGTIDFS